MQIAIAVSSTFIYVSQGQKLCAITTKLCNVYELCIIYIKY